MENTSIWLKDKKNNKVKELNKNIKTDILIIGGGITGLSTLYNLKNSNLDITLVDSNLIGCGTTSKSTAKINYLQEHIYYDIALKYDLDKAKLYYDSQITAINNIVNIIRKEKIDCNLEKVKSYVYTNDDKEVEILKIEKQILELFDSKVKEYSNNNCKYALSVDDTYTFNPLKYLDSLKDICLKDKQKIYENTKIINIEKEDNEYICYTDKYYIKASKIVIACHYPFFLFPFFMPLKAHIEKSYIMAYLNDYNKYTYITSKKPTKSVRFYKDKDSYKIYLSNSVNICHKLDETKNYQELIKQNNSIEYVWKNDDLLTLDKIPYIGIINKSNPNILIGTGYNTWGITNGTLAGLILRDIILNKNNKYINLCSPLRTNNITYLFSYLYNLSLNVWGYLRSKLRKNKKWYTKVRIVNENGKSIGIYEENNKQYKVYNKCPHMGCSLIFNEVNKTWDCPCHASSFDIYGKCIKGPSKYDISKND